MDKGLKLAIEAAGSGRRLAAKLGVSQQAVQQWRRIPAERVIEIERLTMVPRERLRPAPACQARRADISAAAARDARPGRFSNSVAERKLDSEPLYAPFLKMAAPIAGAGSRVSERKPDVGADCTVVAARCIGLALAESCHMSASALGRAISKFESSRVKRAPSAIQRPSRRGRNFTLMEPP